MPRLLGVKRVYDKKGIGSRRKIVFKTSTGFLRIAFINKTVFEGKMINCLRLEGLLIKIQVFYLKTTVKIVFTKSNWWIINNKN